MFGKLQVFYISIALLLQIIELYLLIKNGKSCKKYKITLYTHTYIYITNYTLSKKIKIEFIVLKWTF